MRLLLLFLCGAVTAASASRTFEIDYENNCFLKDGQPYRYISGTIHYFRVPAKYWEDRLLKMRALGCNAVQTYIMWLWHEPVQGHYSFSGSVNITRFLTIANRLGLDVILRIGPYSDAEQDMGGFPAWTLKERGIQFRTSDPRYTQLVKTWWDKLLPMIKPFLYTNGGPVIMVQVENEYGWWSPIDKNYTSWLFNLAHSHFGDGIVYFTTDPAQPALVKGGHIEGPLINSEFYPGWFTEWGEKYVHTPASAVIKTMNAMYALNASFNIYLVHGGTNFGYAAGAEHIGDQPFHTVTTSYDWSAPIREDGHTIGKFFEMQQAIHALTGKPIRPLPPPIIRQAYGSIEMRYYGTVFDHLKELTLDKPVQSRYPLTAEDVDHYYGFLLYEVKLPKDAKITINATDAINDRGDFFLNRRIKLLSTQRAQSQQTVFVIDRAHYDLDENQPLLLSILVENQGRICYTPRLTDYKGIVQNITANGKALEKWTIYRISFTDIIRKLEEAPEELQLHVRESENDLTSMTKFIPSLFVGEFDTKGRTVGDTWIDTTDWGKGQMFTGKAFGLGRYWPSKGPQLTLYHPMVQAGKNQLVFFELDKPGNCFGKKCYAQSVINPLWIQ
uniref:Beta-galactosidase n=1 Tax=Plectus sambesii TaxID=2011161 RepID=A0A914V270_9BILA